MLDRKRSQLHTRCFL